MVREISLAGFEYGYEFYDRELDGLPWEKEQLSEESSKPRNRRPKAFRQIPTPEVIPIGGFDAEEFLL